MSGVLAPFALGMDAPTQGLGSGTGLRVLVLVRYSQLQPSSQFRFYQYLDRLRALGVVTEVAQLLGPEYAQALFAEGSVGPLWIARAYWSRLRALLRARRFDVIWLEGELWPRLPAWGERLLSSLKIPFVVDYDDAIFHRYDLHPNPLYRRLMGGKIDTVMRSAAAVTVANDYVAERALRAGAQRIEYLATAVDLDTYQVAAPRPPGVFTIGWIGTPTSTTYLPAIRGALGEACRGGRGRVVLVGSGPVELEGVPLEVREWSSESAVTEIQGFDVGIMPLPTNPIALGKSGLKIIQYMACGRPAIASPVGINSRIVSPGVSGFLPTTDVEWAKALGTLREDPSLRDAMGVAARAAVEREYSLDVTAPQLARLLGEVAGG